MTINEMRSDAIAWLSTGEAARYLGIVPSTLRRLIRSGAVPAYRIGRVVRLQRAELDRFIQSSRIEPSRGLT